MANKKITQLVNKTSILSTDLFPIGDATTGQLYKKTVAELQAAIGGAVISVNGKVGTVVLTTDDVAEAVSPTNLYFSNTRARGAVSATTPLAYNSSTGVFSIPVATTSANGYLSSTDWTTFNGKENILTFSGPLVRTTNTISIPVATTTANGYLSSTDWTTFNNKQGALTLTVTGSSGASTLVGTTLNIPTYTLAGLGGISATFLSGGTGITYNSGTGVIATTITQYTDALARASLSFTAGSGAYNSTTGVITIPTNTSQLTNGAAFITLTSLSGSTGISYNSATGAISYSGTIYTDSSIRGLFSGSTGISYNSTTGAISSTITQYTDALARGAISLTTTGSSGASTYNSTTGVLNIPNYSSALSGYLPLIGGTLTGALYGTSSSFNLGLNITGYGGALNSANSFSVDNYLGASRLYTHGSNATTKGSFEFHTNSSDGSLDVIALKIDSSGNLGLGTASPSAYSNLTTLTINGTSGSVIDLKTGGTLYGEIYSLTNELRIDAIGGSGIIKLLTNSTTRATIDALGNLGLGVTPSAWTSGKVFQTVGGSLWGLDVNTLGLVQNAFLNGASYNYISSAAASYYIQASGQHIWYNAPSGTAGTSVTFTQAMTLASSGNLLVGTTTDSGYKLDINGTGRFSGNLLGTGNLQLTGDGYVYGNATAGSGTIRAGIRFNTTSQELKFFTADVGRLTIDSSGAATFSSTVTATGNAATSASFYANNNSGASGTAQYYQDFGNGSGFTAGRILRGNGASGYTANGLNILSYDSIQISANATGGSGGSINLLGGSVGIGTTSPSELLQVGGASGATSTPTAITLDGTYRTGGDAFNKLKFYLYKGSTETYGFGLGDLSDIQYWAGSSSSGAHRFFTSQTERMRISSGGNVGIGTSSPGAILHVVGTSQMLHKYTGSTDNFAFGQFNTSGDASINNLVSANLLFATANTERGRITAGGNWLLGTSTDNGERLYISGNVRATGTITANSDIRLKKNLERIENALEKVGQISGYTYNTIYDDKRHGGVIAQEIDEVFPEIVNKGNDGLLGVEYGNISALLIEALKEATTKIKALESKVEALQK